MPMLSRHLSLFLSLSLFLLFSGAPAAVDLILLNCGAASNITDISSRSWETDAETAYTPGNSAAKSAPAFTAFHMHPSVPDPVPYETARIFRSPFTYSFPISPGHKFIRLYFYSDVYAGFNSSHSFFSVVVNGVTLLQNFNPFLDSPKSVPAFVKEFIFNVDGDRRIDLTFSPNSDSFAFINGIEIVPLPVDGLYFKNRPIKFVPSHLYYLQDDTVLETLYRLNVGGADVQIRDDSGMFRYWSQDDEYIYGEDVSFTPHDEGRNVQYTAGTPPCSAPETVYKTSRTMGNWSRSLEWAFPVDSGFYYLLRLHFCEIQLEVTHQNERVFTISVDNETAEYEADVIFWTGGAGIPIFRDYIAGVPGDGRHGKKDLRLSLFPNNEGQPKYSNALLNGLEIFKLIDSKESLATENTDSPAVNSSPALVAEKKKIRRSPVTCVVVGSVIGAAALVVAMSFVVSLWRRKCAKKQICYQVIKNDSSDSITA
ncbi:receptor-like protein kinase FERONIA [Andrographis paniculata]|uniref:receptor-like protein kinase FERONIA n=1 Tax=Andrographis paniculata TaxID=175694 RepID=UPI0021E8E817|nr:receptor-like protein kinase FERONIA [Andrographis paniculata]